MTVPVFRLQKVLQSGTRKVAGDRRVLSGKHLLNDEPATSFVGRTTVIKNVISKKARISHDILTRIRYLL